MLQLFRGNIISTLIKKIPGHSGSINAFEIASIYPNMSTDTLTTPNSNVVTSEKFTSINNLKNKCCKLHFAIQTFSVCQTNKFYKENDISFWNYSKSQKFTGLKQRAKT